MLEARGAVITYGYQDSWGTIEHNAEMVRDSLMKYVRDTGCVKVNIIAHSKGGLEARYLVSALGCADLIASITTVSTPHHGSKTMDRLLRLPPFILRIISVFVNLWFRLLGDSKPDFQAVCRQFSTGYMRRFNIENHDAEGVLYQSYAAVMRSSFSDVFMVIPHAVVKRTEGDCDGLVSVSSAQWADFKGAWKGATARGISHADCVDLRRRAFTKKAAKSGVTDICDCYIDIVEQLKLAGL